MTVNWEDIEVAARGMFNVWTSGGDLAFAKEAWGHLEAAGLTSGDDVMSWTETNLRLIALCRIYFEFSKAKWDEDPDTPITVLAQDLSIDRLALGIMAANHLSLDDYRDCDEHALYDAALTVVSGALRGNVFDCLRKAYGGDTGLYLRLSRTTANDPHDDDTELDPTFPNLAAYEFVASN